MEVIATVGILLVIALPLSIYVMLKMPKGRKATTEVRPGEPFEIRCAPDDGRTYDLWAKYQRLSYHGTEYEFGLSFRVRIEVGGELRYENWIGMGRKTMDDPGHAVFSSKFFVSSQKSGLDHVESATVKVHDIGPREGGSEIVVTGTVVLSEGTELGALTLFLAW